MSSEEHLEHILVKFYLKYLFIKKNNVTHSYRILYSLVREIFLRVPKVKRIVRRVGDDLDHVQQFV